MGSNVFTPAGAVGGTVEIAATAASANVQLADTSSNATEVEFTNEGPDSVFVVLGDSAVAATVPNGATPGGYVILAGQSKLVRRATPQTHAAAICDAGETARVLDRKSVV